MRTMIAFITLLFLAFSQVQAQSLGTSQNNDPALTAQAPAPFTSSTGTIMSSDGFERPFTYSYDLPCAGNMTYPNGTFGGTPIDNDAYAAATAAFQSWWQQNAGTVTICSPQATNLKFNTSITGACTQELPDFTGVNYALLLETNISCNSYQGYDDKPGDPAIDTVFLAAVVYQPQATSYTANFPPPNLVNMTTAINYFSSVYPLANTPAPAPSTVMPTLAASGRKLLNST